MSRNPERTQAVAMSHHAELRSRLRGVSAADIDAAFLYGVHQQKRGATYCTITGKSVERALELGIDLAELRGLTLVLSNDTNSIITLYWRARPSG